MPVTQVEDGGAVEPEHVYVIPPNKDVTLREGALRLWSRQQTGGKHMPIDRFFRSLAEDQKGGAIGVILSGTGSDGTAGLEAIKAEGGIVFAQDPRSAQYPGMPESAIAAACADFILPAEDIARELTNLCGRAIRKGPRPSRDWSRLKMVRISGRSSMRCGPPQASTSVSTRPAQFNGGSPAG